MLPELLKESTAHSFLSPFSPLFHFHDCDSPLLRRDIRPAGDADTAPTGHAHAHSLDPREIRYFSCARNYGIFVRKAALTMELRVASVTPPPFFAAAKERAMIAAAQLRAKDAALVDLKQELVDVQQEASVHARALLAANRDRTVSEQQADASTSALTALVAKHEEQSQELLQLQSCVYFGLFSVILTSHVGHRPCSLVLHLPILTALGSTVWMQGAAKPPRRARRKCSNSI